MPPEMTTTACAIAAKQSGSASIASAWMSNSNDCCESDAPVREPCASRTSQTPIVHPCRRRFLRQAGTPRYSCSGGRGRARHAAVSFEVEPVHRLEQRRLVGRRARQLGRHATGVERDHAVGDERELAELRAEEEDRRAVLGELAQQRVDLALRPDVDAPRGVVAKEHGEPRREPAGDRDLLLVSAREPPHLAPGAHVDLERVHGVPHLPRLVPQVDRAPAERSSCSEAPRRSRGPTVCGRSASRRSGGTSTMPRRIASNGCLARNGFPRRRISPPSGLRWPARASNSSSWPWPSSAAMPRTSPGRSANETPCTEPSAQVVGFEHRPRSDAAPRSRRPVPPRQRPPRTALRPAAPPGRPRARA